MSANSTMLSRTFIDNLHANCEYSVVQCLYQIFTSQINEIVQRMMNSVFAALIIIKVKLNVRMYFQDKQMICNITGHCNIEELKNLFSPSALRFIKSGLTYQTLSDFFDSFMNAYPLSLEYKFFFKSYLPLISTYMLNKFHLIIFILPGN